MTREVADMSMHHISRNFSSKRTLYGLLVVVDMKNVYSFNMSDHIGQCELVVDDNVDARTTRRGRPRRSLALGCITLVGTFFN